ncbi:hypothetical protein DKX38_021990 [Salix brachista]|uniref:Uncharacterized protein n=1 Tax=Salix brachista TaxID=2182728 RepID=A0A5N5JYF7_9ROSI|nr:hypothetical protein DKX38_021990 [Salix brachista]
MTGTPPPIVNAQEEQRGMSALTRDTEHQWLEVTQHFGQGESFKILMEMDYLCALRGHKNPPPPLSRHLGGMPDDRKVEMEEAAPNPGHGNRQQLAERVASPAARTLELTVEAVVEEYIGSFGWSQFLHVLLVSIVWVFDSQNTLVITGQKYL